MSDAAHKEFQIALKEIQSLKRENTRLRKIEAAAWNVANYAFETNDENDICIWRVHDMTMDKLRQALKERGYG